jgi:hypothetical protein
MGFVGWQYNFMDACFRLTDTEFDVCLLCQLRWDVFYVCCGKVARWVEIEDGRAEDVDLQFLNKALLPE